MPDEARWWWDQWLGRLRGATVEQRRTGLLAAGSAAVGLVVAATSVAATGPWDSGQRTAERQRAASADRPREGRPGAPPAPAPSAAPVLAPLGASRTTSPDDAGQRSVPLPTGAGLADALEPLLKDRALGRVRAGAVVDVATGRQLYGAGAGRGVVPASTIKLATGVVALAALGPGHRLTTSVTTAPGERGRIVLVGGGDPTLTARATHGPDGTHPASLRELADATARALLARGERSVRLSYDTRLYAGSARHPIGPNENLSPVTALMVDEGRRDGSDRGPADRVEDPAADAARTFARLLRDRHVTVTGAPGPYRPPAQRPADDKRDDNKPADDEPGDRRGGDQSKDRKDSKDGDEPKDRGGNNEPADRKDDHRSDHEADGKGDGRDDRESDRKADRGKRATARGTTLASVRSQPLSALVERMLTNSDNDIAEALARHPARASGEPASFAGAQRAVTARLRELGVPVAGARFADGSGLDRADRVSAATLAQVLVRAADPNRQALRPVLTGLPVAGFTGTLRDRYPQDSVGRGVVRAKTGTLTGVNTLAGTVVDADGRLLTFAFLTEGSTDPAAAQRVLDRLASAVANCGCR
ncbi:D-alanyl-D-alanine carboxypeptidase/D-alanyl-D-alanine-endopeptidase [Streptomyces sp. HSW2009]|uniref:D-alanyl-D-alanine carboxypeptidase/D-alanyl-D-alanine endopeptidase n=1 Tax=Streptomyces sp. HSW2009 TaxID=3142890 RepID=UPI0032EE987D